MKLGIQGLESLFLCMREGATVTGPGRLGTAGPSERAWETLGSCPFAWEAALPHNLLFDFNSLELPTTPGPGSKTDTPKMMGDFRNQEVKPLSHHETLTTSLVSSGPETRLLSQSTDEETGTLKGGRSAEAPARVR